MLAQTLGMLFLLFSVPALVAMACASMLKNHESCQPENHNTTSHEN